MEKANVNGQDGRATFLMLQNELAGLGTNSIKWNFTKFLIDREGNVVKRYAPTDAPKSISKDIEKLL